MTHSTQYTVKPYYKNKSNSYIYASDYSYTTDSDYYTIKECPTGYVSWYQTSYTKCYWYTKAGATASFGQRDASNSYGWDICYFDADGKQAARTTSTSVGWSLEYDLGSGIYSTYGKGRKDLTGVKVSLCDGKLDVWRIPQLSADGSLVTMKYYVRNVSGTSLSNFQFGTSAKLSVQVCSTYSAENYIEKTDYGVLVTSMVCDLSKRAWVKSNLEFALALNEGYCDTPVDVICIGGGKDVYSNLNKLFVDSTNQTFSSVGSGWSSVAVGYSWKNITLASGNMKEFSVSSGASDDDEVLTQAIANLSGTTLKNGEEGNFADEKVHIKNTYIGTDSDHFVLVKDDNPSVGQATIEVKKGGTVLIGDKEYVAGDNGATILVTSDGNTLTDGSVQIINKDHFIIIGDKTVTNGGDKTITVVADANGGYFIIPANGAVTVGGETYKNNGTKDIIGTLGDGKTTLSVPNNGSVTIGDEKYNAGKNGATIVSDKDGVKLTNGSVWLDIGQSIILGTQSVQNNYNDTLNVTGTGSGGYFTIPANSSVVLGDSPISATGDTEVVIDGTTTTFTIPAGEKITINGKEIAGDENSATEVKLASDGEISLVVKNGCSATIDGKVITAEDSDIPVVLDDGVLTVTIPASKTATIDGESYKNAKNDGSAVIKVSGTPIVRKLVTGSVELEQNGTIEVCTSATTVKNTSAGTIVVSAKYDGAECTLSVPYQGTFTAGSVVVKNTSVKNQNAVTFEMDESGIVSANGLLNEQIVLIGGVEYKGLNLSAVATGNISTGYTATVTVPMDKDKKPFKVYSIYINGENASFTVPSATGGKFSNGVNGASSVGTITTTSPLTSVQYTTSDNATMEQVKNDLSAITYKGAGTVSITAAQYEAKSGDVYYNGHYYRLSKTPVDWKTAMSVNDTTSYLGYKGHPITPTTDGENKMLITLLNKCSNPMRIWLGAVPSGATGVGTNNIPNAGYTGGKKQGISDGWKWIWGTPEGEKGTVLQSGTNYWSDVQPDGASADPSYVVYIGFQSTTKWDDLSSTNALGSYKYAYSVIEYSPYDTSQTGDNKWVYDSAGNSATSGFSNVQSVSRAYGTDNIGILSDGKSLDGYSGKKIENPSDSQDDSIKVVSDRTNKTDTATVSKANGEIIIGGKGYTTAEANTTVVVTSDGTITLTAGAVVLNPGETIKVGNRTIINDGNTDITVSVSGEVTILAGGSAIIDGQQVISGDSNKTQVAIGSDGSLTATVSDKGGKVTIGGSEYTTDSANTQIKLTTDGESLVNSLVNGSVLLDNGETIKLNGKTIVNDDDEIVTVSASDGVTILAGGSAIIDGQQVISGDSNKTQVAIGSDGSLTATVSDKGGKVTIGGTEYTTDSADTQIKLTIDGESLVNSLVNGSILLDKDETIKLDGKTIVNDDDEIVTVSASDGVTILAGGSAIIDGKNKIISNTNATNVAVRDGIVVTVSESGEAVVNGKTIASGSENDTTVKIADAGLIVTMAESGDIAKINGTEYTANADSTQITVTENGNSLTNGAVILDQDETVNVGTKNINVKATATQQQIIVTRKDNGTYWATVQVNGSFSAGENRFKNTDYNTVEVEIGADGTLILPEGILGEVSGKIQDTKTNTDGTKKITIVELPTDKEYTYNGVDRQIQDVQKGDTVVINGIVKTMGEGGIIYLDGEEAEENTKVTNSDDAITVRPSGNDAVIYVRNPSGDFGPTFDLPVLIPSGNDGTTTITQNGVTVGEGGGSVTVGSDGDEDGTTYTAGKDGATFTFDEDGTLTLTDGSAEVTDGGSIDTNVGGKDITVTTDESTGKTTVTTDEESGTGSVSVSNGGNVTISDGDNTTTYTAGEDGATFTIDEDGKTQLSNGSAVVTKGDSIDTNVGGTTVTVKTSEDGDGTTTTTTVTTNKDDDTVSVSGKSDVTIGGDTYTTGDDGAELTIDENGNGSLTGGSVDVTKGQSINVGDGKTTVTNNNDDDTTITIDEDGNGTLTIPNGGSVTIGGEGNGTVIKGDNADGTTVTIGSDGKATVLVPSDGQVTIGDGTNEKTILSDGDTTVEVANDGTTTVTTTDKDKRISIGDDDYTTTEKDTTIEVTDDGNELVSGGVTLNNGGTIKTNGTTIKSETDGTTVSVEENEDGTSTGTITMTDGGTVTIGDGENEKKITSNGDTTVEVANDGTTTVTTTESGKTVTIGDGNGDGEKYTTTAENTQIEVTDDGNELVSGRVTINNGGTIKTNGTTITSGTDGTTVSVEENEDGTTTGTITMTDGGTVTIGDGKNEKEITSDGDTAVEITSITIDGITYDTTTVTTTESGKTVTIGDDDYTTTEKDTTIEVTDDGNELVSGGVTLNNGGTIKTNGTTIKSETDGTTVSVEENEDGSSTSTITMTENGGTVTIGDGENEKEITSNGNTTVEVANDGTTTVTTKGSGKDVTISDGNGNNKTFTTNSDETKLDVTDDTVELVSGGVTLDNGETIKANGEIIKNTGDDTTVDVKVTTDESGNEKSEITISEGGSIQVGDTVISGSSGAKTPVIIDENGNTTVTIPTGGEIQINGTTVSGDAGTEVIIDQFGNVTVTNDSGKTINVGEDTYEITDENTQIKVSTDGNTLISGGVKVDGGSTIICNDGTTIKNPTNESGEASGDVTVNVDENGKKVTVGGDGSVEIGGTTYTSGTSGTTLVIDEDGVQVNDGSVTVTVDGDAEGGDAEVKVGDASINSKSGTITISGDENGNGNVTINGKGSVEINGKTITGTSDDEDVNVTIQDGKATLDVDSDKTVDVDGTTFSGGKFTLDDDGITVGDKATITSGDTTIKGIEKDSTDTNSKDTKVEIGANGGVTIIEGKGEVSGGSVSVNTGDENIEVTVPNDKTYTIDADNGKVDWLKGGESVTIGGVTYTLGGDTVSSGSFSINDTTLSDGDKAEVPSGKDASVSISDKVNIVVSGENEDSTVIEKTATGTNVTIGNDDEFTVGGKTYKAGSDDTTFGVDDDGKVTLTKGTVKIEEGNKSVSIGDSTYTTGDKGASITSDGKVTDGSVTFGNGSQVKVGDGDVVIENTGTGTGTISVDSDGTITANGDGKITVGDKEYDVTNGTIISTDNDGKITISNGSVEITDGESVTGNSGKEITSKDGSNVTVTTNTGDKTDTITVTGKDKQVTIDGTTYTSKDESTTITIGDDGNVTLTGGEASVPGNKEIKAGDSTYTTGDTGATITSDGKITDGSVTFGNGSQVKVGEGDVVIENTGTGTISVASDGTITADGDGKITVGDNEYDVTNGTVISTDDSGNITITNGSVEITDGESVTGNSGKEITSKDGSNVTVTTSTDCNTDTITVDEDGEVTIDGTTYTSKDENTTITVDKDGKVTLTGGEASVPGNEEIKAGNSTYTTGDTGATITSDGKVTDGSVTFGNGSQVKVGGGDVVIENTGTGTISVDSDGTITANGDGKITVGDGENKKEYEVKDGTIISTDKDGNITITNGSVEITDGESVTGNSGKEITTKDGSNVTVTTSTDGNTDTITVTGKDGNGGTITIGTDEYTTTQENTKIEVTDKGNKLVSGGVTLNNGETIGTNGTSIKNETTGKDIDVTITDGTGTLTIPSGGSVLIGNGENATKITGNTSNDGTTVTIGTDGKATITLATDETVKVGEKEISGSDGTKVEVASDGTTTVTTPKSSSIVTIGDDTYTTGDSGATFTIDGNGNGTLTGGSVGVAKGKSINVGDGKTTVTNNNDDTTTITINADGTGTLTIPKGGSVTIGEGDNAKIITGDANKDTIVTIGKDGKTTVTLATAETVKVGDKEISGSAGTKVEVASDGTTTVTTTGSDKTVTIGENGKKTTYTTGDNGATFTIDGNGDTQLSNGSAKITNGGSIDTNIGGTTVKVESESDDTTVTTDKTKGTVSINGKGNVEIGGTTYTTGDKGATFTIDDKGNSTLTGGSVEVGTDKSINVGDGKTTITNNGNSSVSVDNNGTIIMTDGGKVTVGNDENTTTISGTGDTTLTVDKNGKTTITTTDSENTVTIGDGDDKKTITGDSGTTIEITNDGTTTVTTTGSGKDVTIGDGTDGGEKYTTTAENTQIEVTENGNELVSGGVTLNNGGTIKTNGTTITSGTDDAKKTVTVSSDGTITMANGGTVTIGDNGSGTTITGTGDTTLTVGKNGKTTITTNSSDETVTIGNTTYTYGSDDTEVEVDNDGNVTLTKGSVQIDDNNKSISVGDNTYTTGKNGATITSDGKISDGSVTLGNNSEVKVGTKNIVVENTGDDNTVSVDKDGNVAVTNGGQVSIGGKTYTSGSDNTVITVGNNGKVTLTDGSAKIPNDSVITGNSGTNIKNPTGSDVTVTTNKDNNTDTITVTGKGDQVTIGGTTYTSKDESTTITVNKDGKVTLTSGEAIVPGGNGNTTITTADGNNTYTIGKNGATITSDGKITDGSVTFGKDSKVTIGDNGAVITNNGDDKSVVSVDKDGNVTVSNGGKVDIDGTTYTSKDNSTTITIGDDDKVTLTNGEAGVPGGKTITTADGNSTYTTGGNGATITSDGKLTDGSVTFGENSKIEVNVSEQDVVIENNGTGTVSVDTEGKISVSNGGKVVIGGKQYVSAGDDGTKFEIDSDGNVKITNGATTTSDGKTQIAKDGSVVGGTGNTVQNTSDKNSPITVVNKNNNDYVTVSSGGKVKIGDTEYEAGDKDTTYIIDEGSTVPNIIISDDSGRNANRELVVTKEEEVPEKIQSNVKRDEVTSSIYDVTLLEDGVSVQPDGTLTVRLLIPEIGKERTFRIVHLHDNTVMNIEYTIDGDYAVFTIDKLSEFSFVVDNSASLWWLILILAIITAIEITLILIKKWKNKKNKKMLSLALVGGVIPIYEIVLLVVFGIAVVALGVYVAYLYLPRGKKVMSADSVKADGVNAVESAEKTKSADIALGETATLDGVSVPVAVKFNRSFTAKLILSEDVTKGYFVEITNYILSYKKARCRIAWKNASFSYGRNTISKLAIRGKNLWLYLALDPQEFIAAKYHGEDCSDSKRYQKVPYAVKIKSERGLKFAKELVDILMARLGAVRGDEANVYAITDFPYDTQSNLVKRGLIKVYSDKEITDDSELVSAKFDIHSKVSVSDAKKLLNDTEAKSLVITTEANAERQVRGKGGFGVNIDTLSNNFSAGDTVTLSILKGKGIVPKKEKTLKILARGVIDKPLTVIADNYSADAVKMIVLTGGKAIIGNE